jgi:hypothetical protein
MIKIVARWAGHRPGRPVRVLTRYLLQRLRDHLCSLVITDHPRPPRTRLVRQAFQPARQEPRPPLGLCSAILILPGGVDDTPPVRVRRDVDEPDQVPPISWQAVWMTGALRYFASFGRNVASSKCFASSAVTHRSVRARRCLGRPRPPRCSRRPGSSCHPWCGKIRSALRMRAWIPVVRSTTWDTRKSDAAER